MRRIMVIHACLFPGFAQILERMLVRMQHVGACNASFFDEVFVGTVGPRGDNDENIKDLLELLQEPGRFCTTPVTHLGHDDDELVYERFTLHKLHSMAVNAETTGEEFQVFYCHTKGITKLRNTAVTLWVRTMISYCLGYAPVIRKLLADEPLRAIGAIFQEFPVGHFSGNFWWSTSLRIRNLIIPIGPNYLAPEMWIARNDPDDRFPNPHIEDKMRFSMIPLCTMKPGLWMQAKTSDNVFQRDIRLDPAIMKYLNKTSGDSQMQPLSIPETILREGRYYFGFGSSWIRIFPKMDELLKKNVMNRDLEHRTITIHDILVSDITSPPGKFRDPYPSQVKMLIIHGPEDPDVATPKIQASRGIHVFLEGMTLNVCT